MLPKSAARAGAARSARRGDVAPPADAKSAANNSTEASTTIVLPISRLI